jgi:hypothetical protein
MADLARFVGRDRQRLPELTSALPSLSWIELGRPDEDLLDVLGHINPKCARCWTSIRIDRALSELTEVLAIVHATIAHRFHQDERERIHIRRCTNATNPVIELLGRSIRGREDSNLTNGLRAWSDVQRRVIENLRDAEVEHLHPHAMRGRGEEQVARIEIAMNDALRVRVSKTIGRRAKELDHIEECASLVANRSTNGELVRERATFEPLEDHERNNEAGRRLPGSSGDTSNDVQVALRESIEDPTLITKTFLELLDERR